MTDRERELGAAVADALANLRALRRYRDDAGVAISPSRCERDVWEHIERAIDALRRVER